MKKIALLFLTIDNHNQPDIWNFFLKNTSSTFNIYCHPKYPKKVTQSFLKKNIIPTLAETTWGYLVLGYYELLNEAIKNKDNYKFIFVSNSCIPLKSSSDIYDELIKDECSYLDLNHSMTDWDIEHRYKKFKSQLDLFGINKSNYIKHTGWFILNRYHTELLLRKKDQFIFFNKIPAGDEHFLSILKANQMKLIHKVVTCVEWDKKSYPQYIKYKTKLWKKYDSISDEVEKKKLLQLINKAKKIAMDKASHPKTYTTITKNDLQSFKNCNCFFVRKIDPQCNVSIIMNYITSS